MKKDFSSVRLCVLVADGVSRLPFHRLVREIVLGGADCVQLREKSVPDRILLERARICRDVCGECAGEGSRCVFIVNDRPDVALISRADGVHVGQGDLPPADVRGLVGPDMLIGVSTSNLAELAAAEAAGADYLGVGAVFPTATKEVRIQGLDYVRSAAAAATRPWLAIGGINLSNVSDVVRAGAPGVAVFSAVVASDDPRKAARALKDAFPI